MTLKYTPICEFGKKIVDFSLPDFDGKNFSLSDCIGNNGTLIMFICNHCPYVKAIIKEIVKTSNEIRKFGINSLAIMPNDYDKYEEDSPKNMLKFSLCQEIMILGVEHYLNQPFRKNTILVYGKEKMYS